MPTQPSKDPLHGITLEVILTHLVTHLGWPKLAEKINLKCFKMKPTIKSSLNFLRKTPWARAKVEEIYLWSIRPGALPGAVDGN